MLVMTEQANGHPVEHFRAEGWTDELLIAHGYAVESKFDWNKAPEWATCVVSRNNSMEDYHWCEGAKYDAALQRIETGSQYGMSKPTAWTIIELRPHTVTIEYSGDHVFDTSRFAPLIPRGMKASQNMKMWEDFDTDIAPIWADRVILNIKEGTFKWSDGCHYVDMLRNPANTIHNPEEWELIAYRPTQPLLNANDKHLKQCFTPVKQPSGAPDLLTQASHLLTERGKQYDKSGDERSSAKIVAAFNAVTGRDLTAGEGWLFLMMLKAVRFYSNTETPHRDSLEDLIAYSALHAEEYLQNENSTDNT